MSKQEGPKALPVPRDWKVALGGLAAYTAARLAALLLQSASMPAAVAQAVIAEWGGGRLGVTWSDPEAPPPETRDIVKRALAGAAIGALVAASTVLFLRTTRAVYLTQTSSTGAGIAIAFFTACLLATRDELLLHGVVLRALSGVGSTVPRVLACAVTSAAAAYGEGAAPRSVGVHAVLGLVFGAMWVRDRGAWLAWGAHAAWLFVTALLLSGGAFDAHVGSSSWGGGSDGPLAGSAALVSVLPLAVGALVWAARRPPG
jgi:Type II CAAX prenyl endopeptidase Rce1-like